MSGTGNVSEKGWWKRLSAWTAQHRAIIFLIVGGVGYGLGYIHLLLPSAQRAKLAVGNFFKYATKPKPEKDKLRFVLGWLEDDPDGSAKKIVTDAFKSVSGVELFESAHSVTTSGFSLKDIREDARGKLLAKWDADMAIVGRNSRKNTEGAAVLELYFVPNKNKNKKFCGDESECVFELFGNDCSDLSGEERKCAANMQAAYSFVRAKQAKAGNTEEEIEEEILRAVKAYDRAAGAYAYADSSKPNNILDAARSAVAGLSIRDCPECPEMAVVPAGKFMMGSPGNEKDREKDEGPVHEVTITSSLAVGKYEVTFEEWDKCVGVAGGCGDRRPDAGSWDRERRPVINVSRKEAEAYVKWLSGKTKKKYRLLSEAEWEYAARAGTRTRYSFGDEITPGQANYINSGNKKTVPVGSYEPNDFGLYDMHGNVWEWVQDCWNAGYGGAPTDGSAWERENCSVWVLRSGSWKWGESALRSANHAKRTKGFQGKEFKDNETGFRVARTLDP